jgi:hypothetical protein
LEESGERGLSHPAKGEACAGDAELGCRDVLVELSDDALRDPSSDATGPGQFVDARAARLDDRELGGDEERVQGEGDERKKDAVEASESAHHEYPRRPFRRRAVTRGFILGTHPAEHKLLQVRYLACNFRLGALERMTCSTEIL